MHEIHNRASAWYAAGMAYVVYKWVGQYRYAYLQRSFRRDGKVKTEAVYIGRVSGLRGGPGTGDFELSKLAGLASEARRMMREKTPEGQAKKAEWEKLKEEFEAFERSSEARWSVDRQKAKAEAAQGDRKRAAEREVREARSTKPTPADEANLADRIARWQEEFDRQAAEYAASPQPSSQFPKDE